MQEADALLILDAIDYGLAPGTLKVVQGDEVPCFLGAKKMSLHQTGFQEVLMVAQLTGHYPQRIVLIGCQPEELEDYGGSLRPRTCRRWKKPCRWRWNTCSSGAPAPCRAAARWSPPRPPRRRT